MRPRGRPPEAAGAERRRTLLWQLGLGVALLVLWQLAALAFGDRWISRPTLVAVRLWSWLAGDLYRHLATTLIEVFAGIALGVPIGAALGLWLGRSPIAGSLLRPFVVAVYSIPLVTLAPLFVMWFGLEMRPKIIMISVVVCLIVFFNTFRGAQAIDEDLVNSLKIMGSRGRETFAKIVLPASTAWIMSGIKIALPYSLVAATVGEMLAARTGLGWLISKAASQFDITSLYAALVVLMALGLGFSKAATSIEHWFLRWRHVGQ
jgi:NitT/TauT family transport system permease protein